MTRDEKVYDLGDVELDKPRASFGRIVELPPPILPGRESRPVATGPGKALAGSLSMFVPGLGQMISGEIGWGLFYLSGTGFCAATLWAVIVTLDRLVPTFRLLDVPLEFLAVTLGSLALLAIALHLGAVLHAQTVAAGGEIRDPSHPIVAGLASFLIPGWGQLLAGHRRRAAFFLGGAWLLSVAWLLVAPPGMRVLTRLDLALPATLRDGWGPIVMLSGPLVLWAIAVYDAAAGAAAERNRWTGK
jgi:TM2 domain-containing membrane protein YozV